MIADIKVHFPPLTGLCYAAGILWYSKKQGESWLFMPKRQDYMVVMFSYLLLGIKCCKSKPDASSLHFCNLARTST